MYTKFYNEKGYLVGVLYGDITTDNVIVSNDRDLQEKIFSLQNKPIQKGYRTFLKEYFSEVEGQTYTYVYEEIPKNELTDEELKDMFEEEILNSVIVLEKPQVMKEGYHLVPKFNGTAIGWEFEKDNFEEFENDETHAGTYLDPIPYVSGMTIEANLWYTNGEDIWEASQSGIPTGFDDRNYFDII